MSTLRVSHYNPSNAPSSAFNHSQLHDSCKFLPLLLSFVTVLLIFYLTFLPLSSPSTPKNVCTSSHNIVNPLESQRCSPRIFFFYVCPSIRVIDQPFYKGLNYSVNSWILSDSSASSLCPLNFSEINFN